MCLATTSVSPETEAGFQKTGLPSPRDAANETGHRAGGIGTKFAICGTVGLVAQVGAPCPVGSVSEGPDV